MTSESPVFPDPEQYFDRVRPLLGEAFFRARVAVWDLADGYLVAEALARTGVVHQDWFDDGQAGGAFCHSLGAQWSGVPRAEALERHCRGHNGVSGGWRITAHPRTLDALAGALRGGGADLLLASGGPEAGDIARLALDLGVPVVMTFRPEGCASSAVHLVWAPGSGAGPDELLAAAAALGQLPRSDGDRPEHHLVGLEARGTALALARWLLTRSGETRPDLAGPILTGGRALVARGEPTWPWSTRFLPPRADVVEALARPARRYEPPLALLARERLLVLGLGTGSLFCAEAGLLFRSMVFVDCKEVSAYNPVRQAYGTEHVGRFKGEALADILERRLDPGAAWESRRAGPVTLRTSGSRALGHARLRVSDEEPGSDEALAQLLDAVRPTLAVVAMGRSRDDNFAAAYELRRRGIRHITPTAFPAVTHFKHILTDGASGPCYDCLQGHLPLDAGPAPALSAPERDLFYGGTQPATLAETLPSAHSLLRLARDLALPPAARPAYLMRELAAERNCFVGANRTEQTPAGWLYGVDRPFSMVTFGVADLLQEGPPRRCACGRLNGAA